MKVVQMLLLLFIVETSQTVNVAVRGKATQSSVYGTAEAHGTWAQNSSTRTECSLDDDSKADVMLILDGFNHIGPDDFSRVRDFLKTLVPMLGPFGPRLVRVSLVKNGRDPEAEFYLNSFPALSSVVDAVSVMSQSPPLPGGSTRNALDFNMREIMGPGGGHRENTPDALILVTDRNSSGVDMGLLKELWRKNMGVFVVGVKVTDEFQFYRNIFTVEDYNSISNILKELTQTFCRWLKDTLGRPPPEFLRFTDVQPRRARALWECDCPRVQFFYLFVYLGQSEVQFIDVLGHKRSAKIPHLVPNTSYRIDVMAFYETGPSVRVTEVLTTAQEGVRLSGGPSRCSGFLEVLMDRSWSRVCGKDFGRTKASVVCEELDCGPVSEIQGALFTEGAAVGRSFHCDRAETSLKECESSETLCSAAAHLTCSDAVLRFDGFSCGGVLKLRYKDEWRPVMTSVDPDLDFGSALCEQMGCGSAVSVKSWRFRSGPFWWLQPECVKQRSSLTDCLDLDPHMNKTEGGLSLTCSEFAPVVRSSVSEGTSVSEGSSVSEGVSQRVLLLLGANFSVSCSLDKPYLPGLFHLLSPTGNYTLPAVNHAAHFLFQAFSPAHIGNYTCVYCEAVDFFTKCFQGSPLYVTPGGMRASEETNQTNSSPSGVAQMETV